MFALTFESIARTMSVVATFLERKLKIAKWLCIYGRIIAVYSLRKIIHASFELSPSLDLRDIDSVEIVFFLS